MAPRWLPLLLLSVLTVAACGGGSEGDEAEEPAASAPSMAAAADPGAAELDAWCAARRDEVTAEEMQAVREREERLAERMATMFDGVDTAAFTDLDDVYSAAHDEVQEMFAAEGLLIALPVQGDADELARRVAALPAGSPARAAGDALVAVRRRTVELDAAVRAAPPGDEGAWTGMDELESEGEQAVTAAQGAGLATCARFLLEPNELRVVATIAAAGGWSAATAEAQASAIAEAEPWLVAAALDDRCAVPQDAALLGASRYSVGVWLEPDGTRMLVVTDALDVGTLVAAPGSGETWTRAAVDLDAGEPFRRVGGCPV